MLTGLSCDRCHQKFQGFMVGEFTAGFYVRGSKQYNKHDWGLWMAPEEKVVCDRCMHADPRYVAIYGPLPENE
jgi:hypothetical protein